MFLFILLLAYVEISHLADSSPPKIPFQKLLITCTKPEYSNSTECEYFFSTYPLRNDDIQLVFTEVTRRPTARRSTAWNCMNERLINLMGNPNFDLVILGENSLYSAVINENEPLAIAIWPQLAKYKKDSMNFYFGRNYIRSRISDLQQYECHQSIYYIIERNMLQLVGKIVIDQPGFHDHTMKIALKIGNRVVIQFLVDHGLEIKPAHVQDRDISREGFEWALLHYRHSKILIEKLLRNGSEVVAIAIWEFIKEKNYNDLLFQICNNTVFDIVKSNKEELLKTMLRYCPNTILSNGDILMGIAIKGGSSCLHLIYLLNIYGVKVPPNQLVKAESLGYTENFDWAILDSKILTGNHYDCGHPSMVFDYYNKAVEKNIEVLNQKKIYFWNRIKIPSFI